MRRLTIQECRPFLEYLLPHILTGGLLTSLREFGKRSPAPLHTAVLSWYNGMAEGKSFQHALHTMSTRFPACFERLLTAGYSTSILDKVIAAILTVYAATPAREEMLLEGMNSLLERFIDKPNSRFICEGCFERDFDKLVQRVRLENATEVVLEQEGDEFLHQKYLTDMLVHIIEPRHANVYHTLLHKLRDAADDRLPLNIYETHYTIDRLPHDRLERFHVVSTDIAFSVTFKDAL